MPLAENQWVLTLGRIAIMPSQFRSQRPGSAEGLAQDNMGVNVDDSRCLQGVGHGPRRSQ